MMRQPRTWMRGYLRRRAYASSRRVAIGRSAVSVPVRAFSQCPPQPRPPRCGPRTCATALVARRGWWTWWLSVRAMPRRPAVCGWGCLAGPTVYSPSWTEGVGGCVRCAPLSAAACGWVSFVFWWVLRSALAFRARWKCASLGSVRLLSWWGMSMFSVLRPCFRSRPFILSRAFSCNPLGHLCRGPRSARQWPRFDESGQQITNNYSLFNYTPIKAE